MPYLIDGHNLIPKIAGLSLQATDDENQLIALLQEYCRLERKEAEVFFDKAPPGGVKARNFGAVTARFVRTGTTADDAIRARLTRLGNAARNWTVISSDAAVQASARSARSRYVNSEQFAAQMAEALSGKADEGQRREQASVAPDEMDDWLRLFGDDPDSGDR
jgi:predicted RNA-binding protein with PIN domain